VESKYLHRSKGFSLLELIMAVAILSVGIVVVLQAFSFSAQATGLSCDIIDAVFLAEDKIQELEFLETHGLMREEWVKGNLDRLNWAYAVMLDANLDLYKLDFHIRWQRQARQQDLTVNTYLRK
jgi:prepilin-type N-terminal cleavage/methylation domain-containing protein